MARPTLAGLCAAALWLSACAGTTTRNADLAPPLPPGVTAEDAGPRPTDPVTQVVDGVTVSAWIVPDDEAGRRYGVDLAEAELQAIWLRVRNDTPHSVWLLTAFTDPDHFSADEAAFLFHRTSPGSDFDAMRQRFRDLSIRALFGPAVTYEGHLLVPRTEGGRFVEVTLNSSTGVRRYGFPLRTPDGHFDFEDLDPDAIYPGAAREDLTLEGLHERIESLPCCTSDRKGEDEGDPINIVLIGDAPLMMAALSQGGWSFTHRVDWASIRREIAAAVSGARYPTAPVSDLYLFGRAQDLAFQRARFTLSQRNHMRLWLAPFMIGGQSVWVGQVSRDIGIKLTSKSPTLTTHVIDPVVDETRQYVLESLMAHHRVERFGFVRAFGGVSPGQPRQNLTDDPWFSDGLRLVVFLAAQPVPVEEARFLEWQHELIGPIEYAQGGRRPTSP